MIDLENIKKNKARNLRSIADELLKLYPNEKTEFNFNTRTITLTKVPKALIQKVSEWESCQKDLFVYYFSLPQNTDLEIVHRKVTEAKKNKVGKRAYPRINSASRDLYVGSSKEITKRFKEHLGYGYKGTYAMQLAYWCDDLDLDIVFSCMRFSKKTRVDVIQAFEDGLWDNVNPMLGRRGAR